jgi:hypothetical protein
MQKKTPRGKEMCVCFFAELGRSATVYAENRTLGLKPSGSVDIFTERVKSQYTVFQCGINTNLD